MGNVEIYQREKEKTFGLKKNKTYRVVELKVNTNKKVKAIVKQIEEAQNTVEEMPKPEKKQRSKN